MKNEQFKKHFYIGLTAFGVIAASILFFFLLFRLGDIFDGINKVVSILMPVVYGIALAYLLLPLYNWLCKKFYGVFTKKMKKQRSAIRLSKALSTTISILFAIIIIGGLLALVIPQVARSIITIVSDLPQSFQDLTNWFNHALRNHEQFMNFISSALEKAADAIRDFINEGSFLSDLSALVSNVSSVIRSVVSLAENVVIGIIVAIYILNSTKVFSAQAKKLTYSIFKVNTANSIIHNFRFTHQMVSGFINGRLFEALIVGVL